MMDALRASHGQRGYQVIFTSDEPLEFERRNGNHVFRTTDVGAVANLLEMIAANEWARVDLAVQESALEEIYVKLMTN